MYMYIVYIFSTSATNINMATVELRHGNCHYGNLPTPHPHTHKTTLVTPLNFSYRMPLAQPKGQITSG